MATSVLSTKLDFNNIKNNLKTFLAQQSEFADYDFEGSGLSNILDVLAYNTHYNALTANFALNEAFLSTAQLRSSVVSHAATLGYSPRSRTASRAEVNLSVNLAGVANRPSSIILAAGTQFTSSVEDTTFTFSTLEDYTATDNGDGIYTFLNQSGGSTITIYEGDIKQKTFLVGEVGERQLYVIQDDTIDTTTAAIRVFDTPASENFVTYTPISNAITVNAQSRFYQISEAPNGFYELNFGDGISFGRAPVAGEKIVVSYLSCVGGGANGASSFIPKTTVVVNNQSYTLNVTTVNSAGVGGPRQTIESIRQNAPIAFASQQRLVTAEDYRAVIQSRYATVTDAIAWGGEDNVPPDYGKVFVSLVFEDGTTADQQTQVKNSIVQNLSNNLSILSIDTDFKDPTTTFLEFILTFNFDPNLTGQTIKATESNVFEIINTYVNNNLKKFDGVFRRSELLAAVDDISPAILNSRVAVKIQQRFVPDLTTRTSYKIYFPVELGTPDPDANTLTTSTFIFNNKVCSIRNLLNSTKLQIINSLGEVEVDNIGSYNTLDGTVTITGFLPTGITAGVDYIKVSVKPANESTVRPLRSYILDIDEGPSFATGTVDRQQSDVTLSDGTGVTSEAYSAAAQQSVVAPVAVGGGFVVSPSLAPSVTPSGGS
jgi:hypothetical protein